MDPLGQVVLQKIRECPGFEDAIIAGGYLRDSEMGGAFKDIDVFVPCGSHGLEVLIYGNQKFRNPRTELQEKKLVLYSASLNNFFYEIKSAGKLGDDINGYTSIRRCTGVYNTVVHDSIPVQIIGYNLPRENFGDLLMEEFDYGLNMIYMNSEEVVKTKEFEIDIRRGHATLKRLDDKTKIVKAVEKFIKLKEKYPHLIFQTDLEIIDPKENRKDKVNLAGNKKYKPFKQLWFNEGNHNIQPAVLEQLFPIGVNPAGEIDLD